VTLLLTKRQLNFFTLGGARPPSTSVTSYRKDKEAYVTPVSSTLNVGKVGLTHSPCPELIASLTEIRTKLNQLIADYSEEDIREQQEEKQVDCNKTQENSLSPKEYLGIHKAKDLALQATVRPITTSNLSLPPYCRLASTGTSIERLLSSANSLDAPQSDVKEGLLAISLAAILAASFHSANASEKKEIQRQAK
jgi:hypothetical protein